MAIRYIAAALAAAGAVSAGCSVSGTATVQNAGDATAFATCTTFTGSIAIATGTTDNINIPNVRAITGDFSVVGAPNITTVGADSLEQIGGTFSLNNCQILSSVMFPQLTEAGALMFQALPNLQALGFTTGIEEVKSLNIQNTFLTSLSGINLSKVGSVMIANNRLLQAISFQVSSISQSLSISSNGNQLQVALPNLESASNLTFRNCPALTIPSLANVTGSLGFYENSFDSIATPNLTSVGGTLAFISNVGLTNISMPKLKTIDGGFQIQKNTGLKDLSHSFPDVQEITGAIDFTGNFTSVDLPALKDCRGAFNLQSTSDISSSCKTFQAESGSNNVIKGKFSCTGNNANAASSSNSSDGGSSSSSGTKSDARHLDVSSHAAIGIGALLAAVFGLL